MNQLVLTEPVIADFLTCSGRTELVDPAGVRIGFFEPARPIDPELYARARLLFSDEEIARRCQEKETKTTAEVWAHIAELETKRARQVAGRP